MVKIMVEIELDQASYDKVYGPGSEFWTKYHPDQDPGEYKSLEGQGLESMVVEVLTEGFYDWDSKGWMKLVVNGKPCCKLCGRTEGHKDWCPVIAGPEASEV